MIGVIKLGATCAGVEVLSFIGLPLVVGINMIAGCIDGSAGCNLSVAVGTPSIAGVSGILTRRSCSVADLCVLVVVSVQLAVGSATDGAVCLNLTGCLTTGVVSLIELGATCAGMEVLSFIGLPLAVGINMIAGCIDGSASCDLSIAVGTPGIAGVAGILTRRSCSITDLSVLVVVSVQLAVGSATDRAVCLNLTGCLTAGVVSLVELGATCAGVEVLSFVGLPLAVGINMITGCINGSTSCDLSVAVGTPGIAGVAGILTSGICSITDLSVLVVVSIQAAVCNITYGADCLALTSCFATGVLSLIDDVATTDSLAILPVVGLIGRPHGSRIVRILVNSSTCCDLGVTVSTVGIAGVALFVAGCFLLTNQVGFASVIGSIQAAVSSATSGADCLVLTGSSAAGMIGVIKLGATCAGMEVLSFIGLPLAVGINMIAGCIDGSASCDLSIAVGTPGIAGVAGILTRRSCSITDLSVLVVVSVQLAVGSATDRAVCLNLTGCLTAGVVSLVELGATCAGVEVLSFVGLPLAVGINMITGCINGSTSCDLSVAVGTPGIAGVAGILTSRFCSIADFSVLVVVGVQAAICNITYRADCLVLTSCFAAGVLSLVNQVTTAYHSTFFPVVSLISRPDRSRIMAIFTNCCTSFNLYITARAVGVAGIAFLIARGFLLTYEICTASMIRRIKTTVRSTTNGTNRLFLTSSSAAGMRSTIKLSATTTGMKVVGLVYLPITISVLMVFGCRNACTSRSLGITILTPSVTRIARFVTRRSSSIASLSVLVIVGIQLTIRLSTLCTYSFVLTGGFAASVFTRLVKCNKRDLVISFCILLCCRTRVTLNSKALNHAILVSLNVVITKRNLADFCVFTENSNLCQGSTVVESSLTDHLHSFWNYNTSNLSVFHKSFIGNCSYSMLYTAYSVFRADNDIGATTSVTSNSHFRARHSICKIGNRVCIRFAYGYRTVIHLKAHQVCILIHDFSCFVVVGYLNRCDFTFCRRTRYLEKECNDCSIYGEV